MNDAGKRRRSAQEYESALRSAAGRALGRHPAGVARVEESSDEQAGVWSLAITPIRPGAAPAHIQYAGGDEVTVGFGQTHAYLWDSDPQALSAEIGDILAAVFAGRFLETGWSRNSSARVQLANGTETSLGAMHLPLPWRTRHTRRYAPYSDDGDSRAQDPRQAPPPT